jgi:alanine racemase
VTAARLTIDLAGLAHNFAAVRAEAAGAEVAPVLKADGYGLGAGPVAARLWDEGARAFFVARLSEGVALRGALGGRPATIFVLDGVTEGDDARRLVQSGLTPVLNSLATLRAWRDACPARQACALHFDTGMNRLGLDIEEAAAAAELVAGASNLDLVLVMSHLAAAADPADPRNARQLARFREALRFFPGVRASLAASGGAFLGPDYRFDMVRPGVSLFGGGPREVVDDRLRPVATFEAPILQIRDIAPGSSVGYGSMFRADRPMRIAVVGAGYADGLLRGSFAKGRAAVRGRIVPLAIVSMDLIAIDISDCPDARVGDLVELLGPNVLLDDVAAAANTVAHECLVRLSSRAERIYRA